MITYSILKRAKGRDDSACPKCGNKFYIFGGKCWTCGYDPTK